MTDAFKSARTELLLMAENDRLRELLQMERTLHAETRRKLEKADHDRNRYAKRIRLIQGKNEILSRESHAVMREKKILEHTVNTLERRLREAGFLNKRGGDV